MVARTALPSPVIGINYAPHPHTYASKLYGRPMPAFKPELFWDGDFFSDDFAPQWSSSGRGDVRRIAAMGCNFIRVYNWSPDQARLGGHRAFLSELRSLGLMVAISFRRGAWDRAALEAVVAEAKDFTDVIGLWLIGNEEDLQVGLGGDERAAARLMADELAGVASDLVEAERAAGWPEASLPAIGSPVSFAVRATFRCPELPGGFLCDVYSAFWARLGEEVARARLITCVQTYIDGVVLRRDVFGLSPVPENLHLNLAGSLRRAGMDHLAALDTLVTEIGDQHLVGEKQLTPDTSGYAAQVHACTDRYDGAPLGLFWFEFCDEAWKVIWGKSETLLGVYQLEPGSGKAVAWRGLQQGLYAAPAEYPIDVLRPRGAEAVLRGLFRARQWCGCDGAVLQTSADGHTCGFANQPAPKDEQ